MSLSSNLICGVFLAATFISGVVAFRSPEASESGEVPQPQPATVPAEEIDEALVEKLLGGESTVLDTVEAALTNMQQASIRLSDQLDPGRETQLLQKEIIKGLDELIEQASKTQTSPEQGGVRRKGDRSDEKSRQTRRSGAKAAGDANRPAQAAEAKQQDRAGGAEKRTLSKSDLERRWGYLPPRDRDEVMQGFDDRFLPRYRAQIERYYQRLAEEAAQE